MIRKEGSKYVVRSEKGKSLGSYPTKAEAQKRLRQVEYHKNRKTAGSGSTKKGGR